MDQNFIREQCIVKFSDQCTDSENAAALYDDLVRRVAESAWHLVNLSTRDEVMTTTIVKAIKADVTNIVLHNWVEGEYNHYPNTSDIAHAVGAALVVQCYASSGGTDVYEKATY